MKYIPTDAFDSLGSSKKSRDMNRALELVENDNDDAIKSFIAQKIGLRQIAGQYRICSVRSTHARRLPILHRS